MKFNESISYGTLILYTVTYLENLLNNYGTHFEDYIKNEKTISMERKTSLTKIDNIISEGFSSDLYANIEILKEDEK